MPTLEFRTTMPATQRELFAYHERPGALERLTPPWMDVRVLRREGGLAGGTVELSMPAGPFRRKWVARHYDYDPPRQFCDRQERGPFAKFEHTHSFLPADGAGAGTDTATGGQGGSSVLIDHIEYDPPLGALGRLLAGGMVRRQLRQAFCFRHQRTLQDLARNARAARLAPPGPIRVAITGASGLVGTLLKPMLTTAGHQVLTLVRRAADRAAGEIRWDPSADTLKRGFDADALNALEGVDAVVHLSGENVGAGRWNEAVKRRFVSSRVGPTRLLCQALAKLSRKPRVLVSASAIGFYGDRGDEPLAEDSAKGVGFFPDLCEAWESAADAARQAGIRVVHPRIGAVLSPRGGALAKMTRPFQFGLGGPIAGGRQYVSWLTSDDLLAILHESIFNDRLSGPVNAVAPEPATQRQFAKALGAVLGRPAVLPLPGAAVKLLFGEMGRTLLLAGSRVLPAKLQSVGYEFLHPSLEPALRAELGRQVLPERWGKGE